MNRGGDAVRALDRGEHDRAGELLAAMAEELWSHWRGEENGLFAVMGRDQLYADCIAALVREHRELEALLRVGRPVGFARPGPGAQGRLRPPRTHRQGGGRAVPRLADESGRR